MCSVTSSIVNMLNLFYHSVQWNIDEMVCLLIIITEIIFWNLKFDFKWKYCKGLFTIPIAHNTVIHLSSEPAYNG
jgi:hypothetical protein